ncbi:hypothetical protein C0992_009968, partial [Termitomyces sp. T32_za158]
ADALRRLYPGHSVVISTDFNLNILNHPEVVTTPVEQTPFVTNTVFVSITRAIGTMSGVLIDHIQFGVFKASWDVRTSWLEVQKGSWEEVIFNQDFKKALQKDVYGFFTSEKVYKNLGIPWERGLI